MDIKQAIAANFASSDMLVDAYLADLTPQELLVRPASGANHIAWQLGHLIAAERYFGEKVAPGKMDPLPAGFAERHKKGTAASDAAGDFLDKDEYRRIGREVRANVLRIVKDMSPADFDRQVEGLPPMVKTTGEALLFIAAHWLMHAGQWAVVRRKLGRAPLF
jgi:uncharacterized damage-inducible protein DinB